MIKLVLADLYKEVRKKSFKFFVALIIFVSVLCLVIINKNNGVQKEEILSYPLFSEEEYHDVNKYGSYEQYISKYDEYRNTVDRENNIILKDKFQKSKYLLSYSQDFIFVLGVLIVFIAYHSLSYDYQNSTLRYVFMSKSGRKKIYLSKVISIFILSLVLFLILIFTMLITTCLLIHENILTMKSIQFVGSEYKSVFFIFNFLKNSFLFLVPYLFIIIFSMFLCIIFKGNSFGFILSFIIYIASLLFSQILFSYGFDMVQFTFLPFVDFTYYSDITNVSFNNMIYNVDFSIYRAILMLSIYSTLFLLISLNQIKRDV